LADLDENIIRRSLPFGVDTSIGAVETHASENLILHDSEICDYSDRLLGGKLDQTELLQRGDAVVEPDFLGDLAILQL
jgi:hypothetical protein